ncbi:uncharacterized protein LOC134653731 [Cydia amplana]|uniref:uncharacterized protein LOC134653731 n=1 Tax=Cydia amplana TaxID=1869771 RepID=UPI002FE585FB
MPPTPLQIPADPNYQNQPAYMDLPSWILPSQPPEPPPQIREHLSPNVPQMLPFVQQGQLERPYSPTDVYSEVQTADDELREGSESPDLLQSNQKRQSAFSRLGPLTQPKKPKLTINLQLNKDQAVREVVNDTDESFRYVPVHLRKDILESEDEIVKKYLPFWPWKKNMQLRKTVSARLSKSVMLLEQEQMEAGYEKDNVFIQVVVTGYPKTWTKEDVLDAVLECVKGKSFIPLFTEFTSQKCRFLVIRCQSALVAIHKVGFCIRKADVELTLSISLTDTGLNQIDLIPRLVLRRRLMIMSDENHVDLTEFLIEKDVSHFVYFPLNRPTNQMELIQLQSAVTWEYLTELNLSRNRLTFTSAQHVSHFVYFPLYRPTNQMELIQLQSAVTWEYLTVLNLSRNRLTFTSAQHVSHFVYFPLNRPTNQMELIQLQSAVTWEYLTVLNLSRNRLTFTSAQHVSHFVYFPLNRPTNQMELIQLQSAVTWEYLTELNLSRNRLTSLGGFDLHKNTPRLKRLDLSHNYLDKVTLLLPIRDLPLRSLRLEGNPLCRDYIDPGHYIKVVRMMFHEVMELDGVRITLKGDLPSMKRNYCPEAAAAVVEKFLETFFPLLEAAYDDRAAIEDLYDKEAVLTITFRYKLRYGTAFRYFRNLFLRARSLEEEDKDSVVGAGAITSLICKWPDIEHDRYTISVDVIHHDDFTTILRLGGVLKLTAKSLAEDEHLLTFTRTVVLHSKNGAEYKITNEMLYWDVPREEVTRTAFNITTLTAKSLAEDEHLLTFTRTVVLHSKNGAEYKITNEMLYWDVPREEVTRTAFNITTVTFFRNQIRSNLILKLTAKSLAEDEHLLTFTRTVVLHSKNGAEYKITNEMLYWDVPREEVTRTAFNITTVRPKQLSLKLESPPDEELKSKLTDIFVKLADIDKKRGARCLELKNWDLRCALDYYIMLLKLDDLAPLSSPKDSTPAPQAS